MGALVLMFDLSSFTVTIMILAKLPAPDKLLMETLFLKAAGLC